MKKVLSFGVFGIILWTFLMVLRNQDQHANPDQVLEHLIHTQKVKLLNTWDVDFESCKRLIPKDCSASESRLAQKLPMSAKPKNRKVTSNLATITRQLTKEDRKFLSQLKRVAIVVPRVASQRTSLIYPFRATRIGQAIDASVSLESHRLLSAGKIQIEFDTRNTSRFGPTDLPIALVALGSIRDYSSIVHLRASEGLLTRQYETGLPFVLATIGLVLDHMDGYQFMVAFSVLKGVRSYFYSLDDPQSIVAFIWLMNCLYLPLLVFACMRIAKLRLSKSKIAALCLMGVAIETLHSFAGTNYLMRSDLVTDTSAALIAIVVLLLSVRWYGIRTMENVTERLLALVLLFIGLVASLIANIQDLVLIEEASKDFSNPLHFALLPSLAAASLFGMGSISVFLRQVREKTSRLTEVGKDLEAALQIQKISMPARTGIMQGVSWRAFWWPSKNLSGDAYDIAEMEFNGSKLQVVCIVDVAGHGIASGISVSLILATFKWWARGIDLCQGFGYDSKEKALEELPAKIEEFLQLPPDVRGCTAGFAMVDTLGGEVTYCTAGHSGFILSSAGRINYLFGNGNILGGKETIGIDKSWNAKTTKLPSADWDLVAFTDGVLEPHVIASTAAARMRRQKKEVVGTILNQMRKNKSAFRKETLPEDDMTMLVISSRTK